MVINLKLQKNSATRLGDNNDVRLSCSAHAQQPPRCLIQQSWHCLCWLHVASNSFTLKREEKRLETRTV